MTQYVFRAFSEMLYSAITKQPHLGKPFLWANWSISQCHCKLFPPLTVQSTTAIVETVIVESTVLVEQKPLTKTQFYFLQTTILVETTVIVEQKPLTVFSTITVVACT